MRLLRLGFLCLLSTIAASTVSLRMAYAASVSGIRASCWTDNKGCTRPPDSILIEGAIAKGDAKKFYAKVMEVWLKSGGVRLILRSPGGNVGEALEIGRFVRMLLIETIAPFPRRLSGQPYCPESDLFPARAASCVCASACFLIYAAGVPRNMAYVLLHRPYINPKENAKLDIESSSAVSAKIRADVASYLREMEIPEDYATRMFATPSDSAIHIDYEAMRDRIAGYPAAIDEWLMAKCGVSSFSQDQARFDALSDAHDEMALREFERQSLARRECTSIALQSKRNAAIVQWGRKYSLGQDAGSSLGTRPLSLPNSSHETAAPSPPPDFCRADDLNCKHPPRLPPDFKCWVDDPNCK